MTDEQELPELEVPQRAEKPNFLTSVSFEEFNLPSEILMGIKDAGFTFCTPIQARVLPLSLTGKDVAGQAQTGTGKTAAFLITVMSRILEFKDRVAGFPSAIIVAPTRELAQQIDEEAGILCRYTGLTHVQVVGGVDYQKQADILRKGVDIVICTPGRIIDYFKQGIFKTAEIKIVVIDEADRLLDLGFSKDMRYILQKLPHYQKRQSMLFSATLSYSVLELTYEYMNLPEFISVAPEEVVVDGINQSLFHVGKDSKFSLLLGLFKREEWSRALIFVNTKSGVEWVTEKLKRNGYPAEGITGDLPQRQRFSLMERFKNGSIKILVATDVASRGIHVEDITHVINYDLPQDAENYIHRIGRTARAGKDGIAISLACEDFVLYLESIEAKLGHKIPVVWPEDDWFVEDISKPVFTGRRHGKDTKERFNRSREKQKSFPATTPARQPVRAPVRELEKKPGKDHFPGSFFGFAPDGQIEEKAELASEVEEIAELALETKTDMVPAEAQGEKPKPKKKRRFRRKSRKKPEGAAAPKEA
ncbi:MAG: DEAD/DEAH box helicase [Proteobacteria bacterium]|nr:DEAD/DEAH box helicase [Pseudomonadota bacterium]MBU1397700.1 DEAD/DEAH box helicase [Pseudomonadota bacterium]MBU1570283.1 DEAD/DEAH box helicase [Pseudomonadota bacterium]